MTLIVEKGFQELHPQGITPIHCTHKIAPIQEFCMFAILRMESRMGAIS